MLTKEERGFINRIKIKLEEKIELNISYLELYDKFNDKELKIILSSYHYELIKTFEDINSRLLGKIKYIHADISR